MSRISTEARVGSERVATHPRQRRNHNRGLGARGRPTPPTGQGYAIAWLACSTLSPPDSKTYLCR
jgi:hypothetical protein